MRGDLAGGGSRPTPKGEVEGDLTGGSPGSHLGEGDVCCSWGGACSRGVPAPGGACSDGECGDPPVTATAAGSTHPTGMHSCRQSLH